MPSLVWHFDKQRTIRRLLWVLVAVGLCAGVYSASNRWHAETRNRSVEICLDYSEVLRISVAEHRTMDATLRLFAKSGVTSNAVTEENIASLEEQRLLTALPAGRAAFEVSAVNVPANERAALLSRVAEAIKVKSGAEILYTKVDGVLTRLHFNGPYNVLRGVGIGLNPDTLTEVRTAGLSVIGRVANYTGVRPGGIVWSLHQLHTRGIKTVIFSGDEALGFQRLPCRRPSAPGRHLHRHCLT